MSESSTGKSTQLASPGAKFRAAVAAAHPRSCLPPHLPEPPRAGRLIVLAAGKAAGSMTEVAERHYLDAGFPAARLTGLAVTRHGYGRPTKQIEVVEAGHPVPDEAGEKAAHEILRRVKALTASDRLLVLVSGGGSSLLTLPAEGISIDDIKTITKQLLTSGTPIQEMNIVRKHLSAIQGGRLAAACRAPVTALVISDVTGDDPTHIASGPCAPDTSTYQDALDVIARHGVKAPKAIATARGDTARRRPKPAREGAASVGGSARVSAMGTRESA